MAGRKLTPCGTRTAYNRHLRHRETPCAPCREANRIEHLVAEHRRHPDRRYYTRRSRDARWWPPERPVDPIPGPDTGEIDFHT